VIEGIGAQVKEMQAATRETVDSISDINGTITALSMSLARSPAPLTRR